MNKWAPGLIIFGFCFGLLSVAILYLLWRIQLVSSSAPDYTLRKLQMMFRLGDSGSLAWPAAVCLLVSIPLFIRGVWLLMRPNYK